MNVVRFGIKNCCGSSSLAMKLSHPLSKDFLPLLMEHGFKAAENYSKAGILYIENEGFIVQGPFGSKILQIKCKITERCRIYSNKMEDLLRSIGEKDAKQTKEGE